MEDLSRRALLGAATAAAAAGAAPDLAQAALGSAPAKLSDIDHIIILMKENRSFDHYFGALRGVRGFDDPTARRPDGGSVFRQPDAKHPDGHVLPFRLDSLVTSGQRTHDLSHAWSVQHASWNGGAMDSWISAHRASDGARAPMTMGYLTREDLPYYYALADAFTICDGYHCSMFAPTHPNRYHLMTATNDPDGRAGGPGAEQRRQGLCLGDLSGAAGGGEGHVARLSRPRRLRMQRPEVLHPVPGGATHLSSL